MSELTLYGPHWSAYTRTARLALHEKKLAYTLVEVDFSSGQMPAEHLTRHPFGKVPVLDHGGFSLFETSAICRYLDTAFEGPALQPVDAKAVGRMAQIIGILDNYLSDAIRMGYLNELVIKPMLGLSGDTARIDQARRNITHGLSVLANCTAGDGQYLVGERLSLADLHTAPLFDFLCTTEEGNGFVRSVPRLRAWWDTMSQRPSMLATTIDLEVFRQTTAGR